MMAVTEPEEALLTYLLNGASNAMNIDGTTPVNFSYLVGSGKSLLLHRILFYIDDATAFASDKFGGITALTNGVDISVGGNVLANWKDNVDIVSTCFDFQGFANFGKTTSSGAGRWTMARSFGASLPVSAGESIVATVSDDLTGLTDFRMTIHGSLTTRTS